MFDLDSSVSLLRFFHKNHTDTTQHFINLILVLIFSFAATAGKFIPFFLHCVPLLSVSVQAEGFHGELEEFLQWLRRTDSQLSAAKPTGGLPETAREQLQQHMVSLTHSHTHLLMCTPP